MGKTHYTAVLYYLFFLGFFFMQIQINVGKLTSPMPRYGNAGYVL